MRAISRSIGGSALARRALAGTLPDWYLRRPAGATGWGEVAANVANEFADDGWLARLLPAFEPSGPAAERLRSASRDGGLVVTGGQQPGLFGGPLYVLHKALTLLEMSDALASLTGRAVAPVFWAATDDADLAEANHVSVVRHGELDALSMAQDTAPGRSMMNTPLGDVAEQTARLEESCGSAPDVRVLDAVRAAYSTGATVGSAYVTLLRSLLEPLGIAVLDASHPAVRIAGRDTMRAALTHAADIAAALSARTQAISAAGLRAQVADVPNLSLVFETLADGTRRRIPLRDAGAAAAATGESGAVERLGPNVLLRPILERAILPTVSYVGGAGEVGYFAQVSAVADAMHAAMPRISPRWSGTLVEPHIQSILDRFGATIEDFSDPHAMEGRVARAAVSPGVKSGIAGLRAALDASCERLRADEQTSEALARSVGTMRAGVEHRLARLERRYSAAVKRAGSEDLRDVAAVRATLYPNGVPQERVLSFIPFLARYGAVAVNAIREQARLHVTDMIHGD